MQPPPSPDSLGEPLYEAYYGLREQPFALSSDPRFLFLSGSHRRAYDQLLTGLRRREGILLLTGEVGTGKTTLCRAVIDALGHRTFAALILNPYMSDAEVLRVILRDFGLVSRDEIRRGAFARADMPQLLDTLEGFLRSLLPLNSYAVVIIDEAQSLLPRVLDQLRMLGGYEMDGQRLLQIVLVGQPELASILKSESLVALNERITRRTSLAPLSESEIDQYINHRLTIAGGRGAVTFQPQAIQLISELSRGLPRRINMLCDRALEEGRASGKSEITGDMIKRAATSIAGTTAVPDMEEPSVLVRRPEPALTPASAREPMPAKPTDAENGLTPGGVPTPQPDRLWLTAGAGTLLVAAVLGAGLYGRYFLSREARVPPLPRAPQLRVGQPPPAIAPPTEADIKAWGDAIRYSPER